MSIIDIILTISVIISSVLATIIYFRDRKNYVDIFYGLAIYSAALWAFAMIMFRLLDDIALIMFWGRILYIAGANIGLCFLFFGFVFPNEKFKIGKNNRVVLLLVALCMMAVTLSPYFIKEFRIFSPNIRGLTFGFIYPLYSIYLGAYLVIGLWILVQRYKKTSDQIVKKQILFVFVGSFSAIFSGLLGDIVLPYFGFFQLYWFGPAMLVVMAIFIFYAIVKHHLMDIKVIATELLTALIVLVLLIEFLLSKSPAEFALRGVFLVAVSFIGYLLIKSVLREVHQREQLEELTKQLEIANKELERLDQAKSEFLSMASHQLRTPLTAIKGYSSMLLDGTFGPVVGKVKEGVDKVYQSTERMVALVNDLLDTSRLESGRMIFTFVETDLGEITKSVCDELMPKAQEKSLTIRCIVNGGTPKVFVDQMKIRQVLINFVDNALKYSDTGIVEVKLEQKGEEVVFSVHDNGWGMTPEEMGFLFKKFSRGRGDTSQIKGTGLGLYVARRLAEAHGGRVWAESPGKGQGSTFLLALKIGWKPQSDGMYVPKDE